MSEPPWIGPFSSTELTRRNAFMVLQGAALATSQPFAGGLEQAAPIGLLTLRPLWQETMAAFNSVLSAKAPLEQRRFARRSPYPDHQCFGSDAAYQAEVARFESDVAAIELEEGLTENGRLEALALETYRAIVDRIIAIPSRSSRDLLFKAEVSRGFMHTNEELARSIIADLVTVLGSARPDAVLEDRVGSAGPLMGCAESAAADRAGPSDVTNPKTATPGDEGRSHE